MWRTACFLNNQVIRNKEVMRLKMLYKITVANHEYCVLGGGGVSCFTSSTASLGNDSKTPFKRRLVLINQRGRKALGHRIFTESILLWHHILLKGTLMSCVIQARAIQKIWEWSQQDFSQHILFHVISLVTFAWVLLTAFWTEFSSYGEVSWHQIGSLLSCFCLVF